MTYEELLELIAQRNGAGGVVLASHYLKQVFDCTDGVCGVMPEDIAPIADWQKAIDDGDKRVVFSSDDLDIEVRSDSMKAIERTAGACMDFIGIMTSPKKDRDGDVLETKGAEPDPKMPYLFMHSYFSVGGKLVEIKHHSSRMMKGHFALMDTPLGNDMAKMIEFKALRNSIGFLPLEWEPIKDSKDEEKTSYRNGYKYKRFKIMETSGVPVPSNEDAWITAYSRKGFASPMAKLYGYSLFSKRPDSVVSGWVKTDGGIEIPIKAVITYEVAESQKSGPAEKSCGCQKAEGDAKSPQADSPESLATKLMGHLLQGAELPLPIAKGLVVNLQETVTREEKKAEDRVLASFLA